MQKLWHPFWTKPVKLTRSARTSPASSRHHHLNARLISPVKFRWQKEKLHRLNITQSLCEGQSLNKWPTSFRMEEQFMYVLYGLLLLEPTTVAGSEPLSAHLFRVTPDKWVSLTPKLNKLNNLPWLLLPYARTICSEHLIAAVKEREAS